MFGPRVALLVSVLLLGGGLWTQAKAATKATGKPSLATLQKQAATGDAEAEAKLGLDLMKSKVPADQASAVEWFRKSAAQGNADGEWNLGAAYFAGRGITRNMSTGLDWMRKSLSDGSAVHMLEYSIMLRAFGNGSEQESMDWLHRSAEAGSPMGMVFFAMAEQKENPADARQWMIKAAQTGNAFAETLLGVGYIHGGALFGTPDIDKGLHWLHQAADQGYADAEGELGLLLISGKQNVPKNPAEGVRWATRAVAQRNAGGYYALGVAYQLGNGEPVDPAKAWYNFAAAQRLDTDHKLSEVGNLMSLVATELTPAQITRLQTEVAKIPLPKKKQQG